MSAERPTDPAVTQNEDLSSGQPPQHATKPPESDGAPGTAKTKTDPHTGEPSEGRPETAGAG